MLITQCSCSPFFNPSAISPFYNMICTTWTFFALIFFHLLVRKPNLEKFSIYSNKYFHNFHLSKSSFTCLELQASGLAWRLVSCIYNTGIPESLIHTQYRKLQYSSSSNTGNTSICKTHITDAQTGQKKTIYKYIPQLRS